MPLSAGDKLGPYEILALIGKGGMGEVYRAHDPRTGRDVAIKVSAERFSERFDREVRAVAALNHPNICTLFDVGPNYLVMEYIEGESPKGPLPWDEALRVMRQIGDAMSEAHEKNIIHRDLKPGNIKIKTDGTVKVLDFGLAKVAPASSGDPENSPTLSMAATQAGVILGTAGYMPPEQARGKPTDKRADIWAFGVVFHELLTGRRAFAGEDVTSTLAKVIEAEPSWQGVPQRVQRLLKKCLEKDPKKRLRDVGDAWELLEESPADARATPSGKRWLWPGIAAAFAIIAATSAFLAWRATRPVDRPLARLEVDLGADVVLPVPGNGVQTIAISPDGTRLAYISKGLIYTRRLDQNKASELQGTNGADSLMFSPDSRWLAFRTSAKLNKISVEGGAVVPMMDLPNLAGASWGESGIVVGGGLGLKTSRLPSEGGTAVTLMEMAEGESFQAFPQLLPGGKAVLFSSYRSLAADTATIEVTTLSDHKRKTLTRGTSPRYISINGDTSNGPGYLIYNNKATLFAVPFDPDRLEMRGTAIPILDDLGNAVNQSQTAQYDVSAGLFGTGTLVYRKNNGLGPSSGLFHLESVAVAPDGSGKRQALRKMPGIYSQARLSPDGKRVALAVVENGRPDLWVYNQVLDSMTRLTSGGEPLTSFCWSPDGKYVVFGSLALGMWWVRADGATQPQILLPSKVLTLPTSFSADGKRLVFSDLSGLLQLWTVPITENAGQLKAGTAEQFLKSRLADGTGAFSPDGKWLAYSSGDQTANVEVYVRAFPPPASGEGGKWQISNSGGTEPVWSSNGRDLLYRAGDQIMAVGYSVKDGAFQAEKPRVWLAKLGGTIWDLDRDGKRVIVVSPLETQDAPKADHEVVFLENFFDELQRKVPPGK